MLLLPITHQIDRFVCVRQLKSVRKQFNEYETMKRTLLFMTITLTSFAVVVVVILAGDHVLQRRITMFCEFDCCWFLPTTPRPSPRPRPASRAGAPHPVEPEMYQRNASGIHTKARVGVLSYAGINGRSLALLQMAR